jgi:hypothetical protein
VISVTTRVDLSWWGLQAAAAPSHCGRSDFILPPYNLPGIVQSGAQ